MPRAEVRGHSLTASVCGLISLTPGYCRPAPKTTFTRPYYPTMRSGSPMIARR